MTTRAVWKAPGERLPPDKNLPKHDAFARIIDTVLGEIFYEGRAGAHLKESKDHGEELQDPAPHAKRLGRGQDEDRQDQVLVNDDRNEQQQAQEKHHEETAQRAVKSRSPPRRYGLPWRRTPPG